MGEQAASCVFCRRFLVRWQSGRRAANRPFEHGDRLLAPAEAAMVIDASAEQHLVIFPTIIKKEPVNRLLPDIGGDAEE